MREGLRCLTLMGTLARNGCWGRECCLFSGTHWKVVIAAAAESKLSVHTHTITVKLSTAHLKQGMAMKRGCLLERMVSSEDREGWGRRTKGENDWNSLCASIDRVIEEFKMENKAKIKSWMLWLAIIWFPWMHTSCEGTLFANLNFLWVSTHFLCL